MSIFDFNPFGHNCQMPKDGKKGDVYICPYCKADYKCARTFPWAKWERIP